MPFKVLENAGLAPAWVELAAEIERRIDEFRAARREHEQRMRRARAHALAGTAGDFAARFRAARNAHVRSSAIRLATDVRRIVRLIDRFNTMAPASAPRFGFLARAELDAVEAIWPWPAPGDDSDMKRQTRALLGRLLAVGLTPFLAAIALWHRAVRKRSRD